MLTHCADAKDKEALAWSQDKQSLVGKDKQKEFMSRPTLNRPKTAAGLSVRSGTEAASVGFRKQDEKDSEYLPAAPSTFRLPSLSGPGPRLSRQPRLWAEEAPPPGGQRAILGEGAFGRVFRATFRGRPAAVKEVGSRPNTQRRRLPVIGDSPDHDYRREVRGAEFLLGLRHENVVQYLQFDTSVHGVLYVVMELVVGRNLTEMRRLGPFSEGEMRSVIKQACCGLHYLHSHRPPIVHRDVKGSNIMLTDDRREVKLVDLGLAILCDECDKDENGNDKDQAMTRRSLAGTYRFMAPEVYEHQAYSAKSDVYALGCATFELLCGRPPHADKSNEMAVCYAVMHLPMPDMPEACDSRLADLYSRCTRKDPVMRPTAAQILRHSFILETPADADAVVLRS